VGTAGIVLGACDDDKDESAQAAATTAPGATPRPAIGPVDQQKQRRFGTGLIAWDPSKSADGLTVFAPNMGKSAYAVNMDGDVVNTWDLLEEDSPASVWSVEPLENGNLLVLVHERAGDAPPQMFQGGGLLEVDWAGNIVWELAQPMIHHDARKLPNGNLLVLRGELVPGDVAARVQGGVPAPQGGPMWTDWVVEITPEDETVWEWHAWEHLDPAVDVIGPLDMRAEWTHANSIDQMPNGDLLISFRNTSTVAIVSRATGEVAWRMGPPDLAQQHHARYVNGNITIFDNGAHRPNTPITYSRVIEVNPETKEIIWEYQDSTIFNFFSPFISSAQRLDNGNTLVTEGNFGRIFEITAEGELVWEYVSPYFTSNQFIKDSNSIFRAFRHPEDGFNRG
jgi:hypothetical protein